MSNRPEFKVADRNETWAARLATSLAVAGETLGAFPLTAQGLLQAAEKQCGLSEKHPEELAEPLRCLEEDFAQFPPSRFGRMAIFMTLTYGLQNRIRVQYAGRPELQVPRRPPIIIVGWYRTGTTFLQALMEAIPGYSFLRMHELMNPTRRKSGRIRAELSTRLMNRVTPELTVLHPVTATSPEECWQLMLQNMLIDGMAIHWDVPRTAQWLREVDRVPAYRNWARNLALLEDRLGHGLILKDPAHMLALPAILEAVPDARLIWTHRDPKDCLASYGSLSAVQHRMMYGSYDPERAGRVTLRDMDLSYRAALAAREQIPAEQLVDVKYRELTSDPVACLERICSQLDLPFDRNHTRTHLEGLKPKGPKHRPKLEQWGLSEERVREKLDYYGPEWWTL